MTKSEIKIQVGVDENRVPEAITWTAEEGKVKDEDAKAMLLSMWDTKKKEAVRIDLWTKEMPVDEMNVFFHQTLLAMSHTFYKATQNEKMTAMMQDFCEYFAEKLDLKKQ